jgi:para-aminobenzoate synthetase component I
VNRVFVSFPLKDFFQTKLKTLNWADRFNICCFLDNNEYQLSHHSHECLLAAGAKESLEASAGDAFDQLRKFSAIHKDWIFGHFGYDLKNETEHLSSSHPDGIEFPDLFFFIPEIVIELKKDAIHIGSLKSDHEEILAEIEGSPVIFPTSFKGIPNTREKFSRSEYLTTVKELRSHILRGDCYEINFCQEFYREEITMEPLPIYYKLAKLSPTPFAAYYRLRDKYLICASPERYLKRTGDVLLAQPIKGTWQRNREDSHLDQTNKDNLFHSAKDRSENVMIVDLVRNDLSKVCEEDSVKVDELYGIYSFPQVHQMISTVSGKLAKDKNWVDLIEATFPMGSMTGAPKKKVLELIERYEKTKRGLFSGAVGYVTPGGDFDFNVVIRSILYNQSNQYLSFQTGSGITFYSQAETEYEECLLKAKAIKKVLEG